MSIVKRRGFWVGVGIVLLVGVVAVLRVQEARTPEEPSPTVEELRAEQGIPVAVVTAERGSIELWEGFTGTVSGVRDAVVRARTADRVAQVLVAEGDRVSEGQLLVEVAGESTRARLRQVETQLRQAERAVERMRPLHEAGAISEQEWEDVLVREELAREELATVRDALELTSPLAGTVTEVMARPGVVPDPGDPFVRIADLSGLVVRSRVSASRAQAIRPGQRARVPGTEVEGEVRRVALQADPVTRLVEVEIAFGAGAGLVPGSFVSVEVLVDARDDALLIPREALRDEGVWVIDDEDRAHRRDVEAGLRSAATIELLEGVDAGERVVVEGASLLGDGARVRVVSIDGEAR